VKSSTPYPISLSAIKLKKILDVFEPMDTDIFNMGVCILAHNALARVKTQRKPITKHYIDLECMSLNLITTYFICYDVFLLTPILKFL
jgi:hypothetical protein